MSEYIYINNIEQIYFLFLSTLIIPVVLFFCTSGKPRNISVSQGPGEKKLSIIGKTDDTGKKDLPSENLINKDNQRKLTKTKSEAARDEMKDGNNNVINCDKDDNKVDYRMKDNKSVSTYSSTASINVLKDSTTSSNDSKSENLTVNSVMSTVQIGRIIDGIEFYKNRSLPDKSTSKNNPTFGPTLIYTTNDDVTLSGVFKENGYLIDDELKSYLPENLDLLGRIVANGPRKFIFGYEELYNLLSEATAIFESEPSLLTCPIPCVVYGDIHGQYSDLFRWFQINGWPYNTRSVFLGDFVDRGTHGIEVIALLCSFKIKFRNNVYIVRGNHEEEALNKHYSFYDEVLLRFGRVQGQEMYKAFKRLFSFLPLSVLIGKKVLAMHGGLSPRLVSLKSIYDIKRPIVDFKINTLACDLVWSDPNNASKDSGYSPNYNRDPVNSIGQLFGKKAIESTFNKLNIEMVIRGHQVPLKGSSLYSDGRIMTLFSAPGYRGKTVDTVNWGASCTIDSDFVITLKKIRVTKEYRDNRKAEVALQMKKRKLNFKIPRKSISESEKSDSQRA
uniref:Serine/threonine-protein phosphatase n=1 Tax=Parastrongyloides trichosuri TaxID=131310 RepID=A0A0N4ZKA5_PARTI